MTRTTASCFVALIAGWLGCGSNPPPDPTPPLTPTNPDAAPQGSDPVADPSAFLEATGHGADEAGAYSAALDALAAALYGSPAWARVLDTPVHDRARDRYARAAGPDGQVAVTLGVSQERAAEILAATADRPWQPRVPELLADVVGRAARIRFERMLCERRQALLGDGCVPPEIDGASAEMDELASRISLRPRYRGGVPLTGDRRALRPITVIAEYDADGTRVPLPGIPARAIVPDGSPALEQIAAVSDRRGVIRFPVPADQPYPDQVRVGWDTETLLGPLADSWKGGDIPVAGREVGVERWAAQTNERVAGRASGDKIFLTRFSEVMHANRASGSGMTAEEIARQVATADPRKLATALPELADAWDGRVDVLVIAEIDSDYASRLGSHRVWYEARGRVTVYDVWTGHPITSFDETISASGVGDIRADRAARTELAEILAKKLLGLDG